MKRGKKHKHNKASEIWKSRICDLGCIVCNVYMGIFSPGVPHHPLINGCAAQDVDAICLCPLHHQTGGYGVAFHATGRKDWEAKYGTEAELHQKTRELLGDLNGSPSEERD